MRVKARDFSFVLSLLIVILISIYFVFERIHEGAVDQYLALLGDRVLELVPEGPQRDLIAAYYQQFREDVQENRIEPERVEAFASAILNMSYADTTIHPDQIVQAFRVESLPRPGPRLPQTFTPELPDSVRIVSSVKRSASRFLLPDYERWKEMSVRLEAMLEFEENLKQNEDMLIDSSEQITIRIEQGMRIALDSELKDMLNQEKARELTEKLKQLEELNLIRWNEASRLKEKRKRIETRIDSLKKIISEKKRDN